MKRGTSGLSLMVGVDKPIGLSSHDVVNRCRRIFGERRIGHAGTLDPLASGVLPILVGPATRLDHYLVGHDKRYRVEIAFGYSTTTDDTEGETLASAEPPTVLRDEEYAKQYLSSIVGRHMQVPPLYSAIKQGGRKACDEARKGNDIELAAREVEIYSATLRRIKECQIPDDKGQGALNCRGLVLWDVDIHVSKGTYIRAIARDAGCALGCPAHVHALRRTSVGNVGIESCVDLDVLERERGKCALDPVPLLGFRAFFADNGTAKVLANGGAIRMDPAALYTVHVGSFEESLCSCTSSFECTGYSLSDGEHISVLADGTLRAIYRFDEAAGLSKSACVFSTGVSRGEVV